MSMSKNIARLAVTAGLTAALSFGGVMAPVTMAFAAEGATTTTNSITIKKKNDNGSVKYKAYQIFEADVVDESGKTGKTDKVVSNVKWATGVNDTTRNAIIKAINDYNKNEADNLKTDASPQDVANWLTANITGTTNTTVLKDTDLLNTLAGLVAKNVKPTNPTGVGEASFGAGTKVSFDKSGYYLFLTDADTLASDESTTGSKNTATSPIYAVVGAGDVEVTEKTSIPTVNKQVLDDTAGKGSWKNVGDAWIGQVIEYKLTGTVASNIASYDEYKYKFQDHLSVGLDADLSTVEVTIGDITIPCVDNSQLANGYTASLTETRDDSGKSTGHDLTISFVNLKAAAKAANATLNENSEVVVKYKAKLTDKAEYTATGNTNKVKLVYSNNPMTDYEGTSESDEVTDYVFGLDVTKTASDDPHKMLVAGFKVKMTKEGTTPVNGEKWLTETGGLTDDSGKAGVFKTKKDDSKVFIPGLVAGEYEITECETPAGYNSISFTITVTPTYDKATGKLSKLTVTDSSDMVTSELDENVDSTKIPVTIQNKKGSGLPLTGLNGVTFTWIAGGAVLCIGVAHLIRSRKQAEESEQE